MNQLIKKISILFVIILFLSSCNPASLNKYKTDDIINLNGKLTMAGHHPFQFIALNITNNYQIKLIFKTNKDYDFVSKKIGKEAKVKGKLKVHTLKTADNKNEVTEYRLVVEKIKVKELF